MYAASGFSLKKERIPEYFYLKSGKRVHRRQFQKHLLDQTLGSSEREITARMGLQRVWTSGNSLWVKNVRENSAVSCYDESHAQPTESEVSP